MNLGDGIKLLRKNKNLSARGLSIECGLSPSYVNKVENGELSPSFFAFSKLALVLEMTTQEIIFLIVEESKKQKEK